MWRSDLENMPVDKSVKLHILTKKGYRYWEVQRAVVTGEAVWINEDGAVMVFQNAVVAWALPDPVPSEKPAWSKRRLVVGTADYWFQCARDDKYTLSERLLYMENALNHTENHLIDNLKQQGKVLKL